MTHMTHMTHSLYEGLGEMRVVIRGWYYVRRALVREMRHMRHVRHTSFQPHCSACSASTGHQMLQSQVDGIATSEGCGSRLPPGKACKRCACLTWR
jgi:hypothetical protein